MTTPAPLSYVYDGQQCLGHIIARGRSGFEAFDSEDRSLGLFASQKEAAAKIMEVK
jgi:hypothetical protein